MEFNRDDYCIDLDRGKRVRILVRQGGHPQIRFYAVMLQLDVGSVWRTVRLIDNHLDHHHMHRYDGATKGESTLFAYGTPQQVIPQAIDYLRTNHRSIIEQWTT
jgi:hypothetical protein